MVCLQRLLLQVKTLTSTIVSVCEIINTPRFRQILEGPLKKLSGGGKFRAAGRFLRYQIPCMNFYKAIALTFLIGVHEFFFHWIFPCTNIFFYFARQPLPPPPLPNKFSNGPSLKKRSIHLTGDLLISEHIITKFYKWKAKTTFKTQQYQY